MNYIETIYCSQYYELKKMGKDPMKGRLNATLLTAAMILLLLICVGVIVDHTASRPVISRFFLHGIGKGMSGRSLGKIIALVGMASIGGLLYVTYGSEARYKRMIEEWDQLPDEVLKKTPIRALKIFGVVFGAFLLVMILNAFL
jgi:hypothetical protein